jgi:hypothetical protein
MTQKIDDFSSVLTDRDVWHELFCKYDCTWRIEQFLGLHFKH